VPERLFIFIQMEFPWALGPPDGRYLLRSRDHATPEHVVVLGTLGAARATDGRRQAASQPASLWERLRSRGRARAATPTPAAVATSRVTVIDPVPLSAEQQARAWLSEVDRDRDVRATVAVLNRVLHLHRIASADPYIHEVSPAQALVIRAGWGAGEQVADGRWLHARELPWTPQRGSRGTRRMLAGRTAAMRPLERLAAMLGARGASLLCEEFALRARLDLDEGRLRHAALELQAAYAAAIAELRDEGREHLALRISELEKLHAGVREQAQAAMPGQAREGAEPDEDILEHALARLQAALRARSAASTLQR
jgi:hypothetical protein